MAGIAIFQKACSEIEYTHEKGDKHIRIVALGHCIIERPDNLVRLSHMGGDITEQGSCDGHHQ